MSELQKLPPEAKQKIAQAANAVIETGLALSNLLEENLRLLNREPQEA